MTSLIDTGSSLTILLKQLEQKLHLKTRSVKNGIKYKYKIYTNQRYFTTKRNMSLDLELDDNNELLNLFAVTKSFILCFERSTPLQNI